MSSIEVQLSNSNRRLEDNISELIRNTAFSFEDLNEKLNLNSQKSESNNFELKQNTTYSFDKLHEKLNLNEEQSKQANQAFESEIKELLRSEIGTQNKQMLEQFQTELESVKIAVYVSESAVKKYLEETTAFLKEQIVDVRNQMIKALPVMN
jgi:hypothetical protein